LISFGRQRSNLVVTDDTVPTAPRFNVRMLRNARHPLSSLIFDSAKRPASIALCRWLSDPAKGSQNLDLPL
jgi:hypothetical protein